MIKRTLMLGVFTLWASSSFGAESTPYSIQDLLQDCKAAEPRHTRCSDYIRGVADSAAFVGEGFAAIPDRAGKVALGAFGFCHANENITYPQAVQVFVVWAEKNPKNWQQPSTMGVVSALREAWPCKIN